MTDNFDGYPAPEARVREFLEALDQENARAEVPPQDELAWAVPDEGGLVTLTATDLRDVLREFEALRTLVERAVARHPYIVPREALDATDPHATPDQVHPPEISDVPTARLEERYHVLTEFLAGRASQDPRCGCSADNEGGSCYWDSTDEIDEELGRRGR